MKFKILYKIVFLFLIILIPLNVTAIDKEYVYDYGNILDNDTIKYINEYSNFLYDSNDIDYYVVIMNENIDGDIDAYSENVYNYYNISDKGILILYLKKNREIRIIVGEDLSNVISNNIIYEYIDKYFMPFFKKEKYNQGLKNGYSAFYKLLCNYYDIDSSSMKVYRDTDLITKYKYPIIMVIVWVEAILCYVFFKYFILIYSMKDTSISNHFIFMITLFINILLFVWAYLIERSSIVVILFFEIFTILTKINSIDKVKNTKTGKKK